MKELYKKFLEEYAFLYDAEGYVAGENEAAEAFDDFLEHHADFVTEFCKYRGDYITSDREAAAFMFALESLDNIQF